MILIKLLNNENKQLKSIMEQIRILQKKQEHIQEVLNQNKNLFFISIKKIFELFNIF